MAFRKNDGWKYNPEKQFKISRSSIGSFINCKRCFYLDRRLKVQQPPGFPFNLNSAVDQLLKNEFDEHREKQTTHPYIKKLGLDALDIKLSKKYLYDKFKKSDVMIKQLLLNQHIVAGIGNIYASEILFDAKISPMTKGKNLKKYQIGTILKSIRKILS